MHAFEVVAELGADGSSFDAVEVCDWLDRHTLADGGLPFTVPVGDPASCAPWWAGADTTTSSLQMTAQVAAQAHLVARHHPAVARHPWLGTATGWCLEAVRKQERLHAYELLF